MQVIGDELGKLLAQELKIDYLPVEHRVFPDGEVNFKVSSDKIDKDVIIIERKRENENVNAYLLRYHFLTRALFDAGCNITLVMPYFVYARQDEIFRKGEPLSSQYVADLFDPFVSKFFTITAHTHRRENIQPMFKHAKAENISGIPALASALPKLEDAFVLGPDTESIIWSKELAEILGFSNYGAFKKERNYETGEIKITAESFDFKGRDLIVVDDMVSTGGTTLRAIKYAKEMGAKEVHMAFVHPVFAPGALQKLSDSNPSSIIAANTIESPVSVANIIPLLTKYLR